LASRSVGSYSKWSEASSSAPDSTPEIFKNSSAEFVS
jgi:hypothetical protein